MRNLFLKIGAILIVILPAVLAGAEGTRSTILPADAIVESTEDPALAMILRDVLERNPEIATARAQAAAAANAPLQVKALPDPMLALTTYLVTPETRVGPQRLMTGLSQRFPWFGKLKLREQMALFEAAAASADVESRRLAVITEARRLYYEIAFQELYAQYTSADRELLKHYEEIAQARYASGIGLQQPVIKIQAEITRDDTRLLNIAAQRAKLAAALNAMRDRPQETSLPEVRLPDLSQFSMDFNLYQQTAIRRRPELLSADARIEAVETRIDLAKKEYFPDVTLGLTYAIVGKRDDLTASMVPPPDEGQDVLGVNFGVNLPIWREKLKSGVQEAGERLNAAREMKRNILTSIDRSLGDLTQRIPLLWDSLRLFEHTLLIQAEESLRSAEAGYSAGTHNALDLLDAERTLLDVRVATARTRSDYATTLAQLEGAMGTPLITTKGGEQ